MVMFSDFSLDMDEINVQIEEESLMPAQLIGSEYKQISFADKDTGQMISRIIWELKWDRLDMDLTGKDGTKFYYQTSHNMPDPNKVTQNRKNLTYVEQVKCFGKLGRKGRSPEDYIGVKHWIRETTTGTGQFVKNWWKSEAIYVDGQTYEEAMGGVPTNIENINPPSTNGTVDNRSVYNIFVDLFTDGLSHREALTHVRNVPELESNTEIMEGLTSGQLFDDLIEQGFLEEKEGKYFKVAQD
jgi:hypothetical protein